MPHVRADLIVCFTYAVTMLAPALVAVSFRFARARRFAVHRRVQVALLAVAWAAVLALEIRIRLAGGSGAFVAQAPPPLQPLARAVLLAHIAVAVATYVLWSVLASFSSRHRRLGRLVFAGLCFTAASATGMFVLVFVR
jgi:putative membrane protein